MSARHPMLDNILGQAESLGDVLRYQGGEGEHSMAACARLLRGVSGRLIFSGMGASFFAAMPAVSAMARGGLPVQLVESADLLHFGDGRWSGNDAAVLISRSGGSVEVLRLAEALRAQGVRLVGVTNVPGSPLSQIAHETLLIHAAADQMIAVQTYTGTLLALLLLADEVLRPVAGARLAEQSTAALPDFAAFVQETVSERESWGEFLSGEQPLYLLGRGHAMAALHEGSLLFHETAKLPAVPMSSAQFRHGPVEAIAPGTRVIVIGSPEATRSLDGRLAMDLAGMDAQVRWIGPPSPSAAGLATLGRWPAQVPPALHSLFDTVPLQVAAYVAALRRGRVPGQFRFASEITEHESGFPLFEASLA